MAEADPRFGPLTAHPIVWLGFKELYLSCPDDRAWRSWPTPDPGSTADGAAARAGAADAGYSVRLPAPAGVWMLRGIGTRLGLAAHGQQAALHIAVLDALLADLAREHPRAPWLVAPPAQCRGLVALARRSRRPPAGVMLDAPLLRDEPCIPAADARIATNAYVLDWRAPTRQTPHRFQPHCAPSGPLPYPALTTAADYAAGRLRPLGYMVGGALAPAECLLRPHRSALQGRLPPELGLVWTWGTGAGMWQWALRPTPLPAADAALRLLLQPPCHCTLAAPPAVAETRLALQVPMLFWSASDTAAADGGGAAAGVSPDAT